MNLIIEVRAKAEKFNELYQTLQALLPTMRTEDGCRESHIYRDMEDGEVFFLSMIWENRRKFESYIGSIGGCALLGAVDLLSQTSRVRLGGDAPWEEIGVLKQLRKGT